MLDLNLLRVFDIMLEERSVTRAGGRLGLTQSAVSHALNRLRYALNDELFIRGPDGMLPTARAVEMGPQVHAALVQLQAAVAPVDFSPATSDRRFELVAGNYACAVLAPTLVSRLAAEAPLAELALSAYTPDVFDLLDAHRVDFIVGGMISAPGRFASETIATERLAWLARAGHPIAQLDRVELEDLAAVPHVAISTGLSDMIDDAAARRGFITRPSEEYFRDFETALAARGLTRRIGVSVPDNYSAAAVVASSDMITLFPRRLAKLSAESGQLKLIDPPHPSPSIDLSLIYLKERLTEPAVAWMLELIRSAAATI